jgi:hypothetical protein
VRLLTFFANGEFKLDPARFKSMNGRAFCPSACLTP